MYLTVFIFRNQNHLIKKKMNVDHAASVELLIDLSHIFFHDLNKSHVMTNHHISFFIAVNLLSIHVCLPFRPSLRLFCIGVCFPMHIFDINDGASILRKHN